MASSSGRRSGSSARSTTRKQVVIGAAETVRVRHQTKPKGEADSRGGAHSRRTAGDKRTPGRGRPGGHRLATSKRQERENKLARRRWGLRLKLIGIVVAVAALVFGAVAFYRSQVFAVENVVVRGAEQLTAARVTELAAVPEGATLLRMSTDDIEDRLLKDPWIESARADRDFPDTLVISIDERTPVAVVDGGGAELWLIDGEGYWLGRRSAEQTGSDLMIRDVEGLDARAGRRTANEALRNALAMIEGISPELRQITRVISAPTIDKTALITQTDVEIFFGSADDIGQKDRIVRQILADEQGRVVYINVRSIDRPTWRGIDDAP